MSIKNLVFNSSVKICQTKFKPLHFKHLQRRWKKFAKSVTKEPGKRFTRTPLMKAEKYGHIKCVDALIKQGTNVNALDKN